MPHFLVHFPQNSLPETNDWGRKITALSQMALNATNDRADAAWLIMPWVLNENANLRGVKLPRWATMVVLKRGCHWPGPRQKHPYSNFEPDKSHKASFTPILSPVRDLQWLLGVGDTSGCSVRVS